MNRNATGVVGAAVLVSVLSSPAPPPAAPVGGAARENVRAAQPRKTDRDSQPKSKNGRAEEPADFAKQARREYSDDLAGLFLDVCREDREEVEPAESETTTAAAMPQANAARPQAPAATDWPTLGWWTREVFAGDVDTAKQVQKRHAKIWEICHTQPESFIVALVPDPVHTRLALSFDRAVEVIQEAAADDDYQFVKALLPWDPKAHPESDDIAVRLEDKTYTDALEDFPGLMAFRKAAPLDGLNPPRQEHLFVLLVGESPTRGIVKKQFLNALAWIRATTTGDSRSLRIFGPTFSGSLASLAQLLRCPSKGVTNPGEPPSSVDRAWHGPSQIFSGTVTDRSSVLRFLAQENSLAATFASFQEADDVVIDRFVEYLTGTAYGRRGVDPEKIAILSEDETEYGAGTNIPKSPIICDKCLRLRFPREISRLRAAYQSSDARSPGTDASSVPRDVLPLNLEISGADDDTVAAFSKQMPLSQEGVLLGIVSDLRKRAVEFVILRATDPLDLLFLSRYLAAAYPRARIVTIGADMLFRREVEDKNLHGILALSTYFSGTSADRYFWHHLDHRERIFPSSMEAGAYNALRALLEPSPLDQQPAHPACQPLTLHAKGLHLYQYGWLEHWRQDLYGREPAVSNTPPVHLLALGRDEYWPIAHLGTIEKRHGCAAPAAPPSTKPPRPEYEPIPTLLPQISETQIAVAKDETLPYHAAPSWVAAEIAAVLLSLYFACTLWFSSVLSPSQAFAQFAPAGPDAREILIVAATLTLTLILLIMLFPFEAGGGLWTIDDGRGLHSSLWIALGVVLVVSLVDLFHRGFLTRQAGDRAKVHPRIGGPNEPANNAKEKLPIGGGQQGPRWYFHWSGLVVTAIAIGCLLGTWWLRSAPESPTGAWRHAMRRSMQLTSGLSPILPMLLLLAAGLWWAYQISAGSVLLDERRPRLPMGVSEKRVALISEPVPASESCGAQAPLAKRRLTHTRKPGVEADAYLVTDLLHAVMPTASSSTVPYLLSFSVVFMAPLFLGVPSEPLRTLESNSFGWILWILFLLPALALILGTTFRLWTIWLKTRRLLVMLDSLPLRRGFDDLEGFSWKPLWQLGLSTLMEFQRAQARVREAGEIAQRMTPDLIGPAAPAKDSHRPAVMRRYKALLWLRRPFWRSWFGGGWLLRRKGELRLISDFSKVQCDTAKLAGRVLDYLAKRWANENEPPLRCLRRETDEELSIRACERFLSLVYVNFLLVVLVRMRSMIMAISGVYILVLLAMTVYPFQPRATIQALLAVLLVYIITVVTVVFAQVHRNATLSRLTDTKPGELGSDFWIRTASFVALPLFTFFASQFPQVNRFLSSWLEPALKALNR